MFWGSNFDIAKHPNCVMKLQRAGCDVELLSVGSGGELLRAECDGELQRDGVCWRATENWV